MGDWTSVGIIALDAIKFLIHFPYLTYLYIRAVIGVIKRYTSSTPKNLSGETILVTGAASGLGRNVVLQLAKKANVTLVLWDINKSGLLQTTEDCRAFGVKVFPYVVDLSNQQEIADVADKVRREVGTVTILFNNAGLAYYSNFLDADPTLEEKVIKVNLMSNLWTIREFLPEMIEMGSGHVVTTCSGLAFSRYRNITSYVASKYGMRGFLESLKLEMKLHPKRPNIIFSTIYPAWVKTPMTSSVSYVSRYSIAAPLEPDYVAKKIIEGIEDETEEIFVPQSMKLFFGFLMWFLPAQFIDDFENFVFQDFTASNTPAHHPAMELLEKKRRLSSVTHGN